MINFPYTDVHQLNLDWILNEIKKLEAGGSCPIKTVKDYGANGDGITDDSAAILDCINNEQFIIFPPGDYLILTDVLLDTVQNKYMIGLPGANIVEDGAHISASTSSNLVFSELNFVTGSTAPNSNLTCWKCKGVQILNCSFAGGRQFNVQCSTCGDVIIDNCRMLGTSVHCAISLSLDSDEENSQYGSGGYTTITNCFIENAGLDGIIANNFNVTIRDCVIKSCGAYARAAGVYANGKTNLLITGCRISNCSGNGLDIVATAQFMITDCWCGNNGCCGIFMAGCYNGVVRGCHCNFNGSDPINNIQNSGVVLTSYNGSQSANVHLTDCFCQNNEHWGFRFLDVAATIYINALLAFNNTDGQSEYQTQVLKAEYQYTT